jgi:drug/metabolite transporter (DMT)-like permease
MPAATSASNDRLAHLAPALFVLIWSTGFIVARLVAPHADPLSFLGLRFSLAVVILAAAAFAMGAVWPRTRREWRDQLIAGVLLHGIYLGGVFWSVKHGLPAGIAALIVGLQPLMTGMLVGVFLGETVSRLRWTGIIVGFLGAILVVVPQLGTPDGFALLPVLVCLVAMLSITLGTIWQKKTGGVQDLRTSTVVHFIGAALVTIPLALILEEGRFELTIEFWIGLIWAIFGLSIGAIFLLLVLIRRGAVAGVAALLYLVPPVSALIAYFLFGETLSMVQIGGMAVAAVGVAIASRG